MGQSPQYLARSPATGLFPASQSESLTVGCRALGALEPQRALGLPGRPLALAELVALVAGDARVGKNVSFFG
jgi:hypothetical protein